MKRAASLLFTLIFGLIRTVQLFAQCTLGPACIDTGEPGEYYPQNFPAIVLGLTYDDFVQIRIYNILGEKIH